MTYLELKTQFTALINRTDLTTALTDIFMGQALIRAARELRVPAQELLLTTTVTGGYTGIPVPSGFLQLIQLTADGDPLTYITPASFLALDALSGTPLYYTRYRGNYQVYPSPATGVVLNLDYWGQFAAFSGDSSTTTMSIEYPDLLIYGALSYAADYFIDERSANFEGRYTNIRDTLLANASVIDGAVEVQPAYYFGDPLHD